MHIISFRRLREFWEEHPDAEVPLRAWYKTTKKVNWSSLDDTRKDFPHADLVGICTVFNIKGNKYRLITQINYQLKRVYIRFVLTHAEYDKEKWKPDCGC